MLISCGLGNGLLDLAKFVRLGLIKSLKDTCLSCIFCFFVCLFVCEIISTYKFRIGKKKLHLFPLIFLGHGLTLL